MVDCSKAVSPQPLPWKPITTIQGDGDLGQGLHTLYMNPEAVEGDSRWSREDFLGEVLLGCILRQEEFLNMGRWMKGIRRDRNQLMPDRERGAAARRWGDEQEEQRLGCDRWREGRCVDRARGSSGRHGLNSGYFLH